MTKATWGEFGDLGTCPRCGTYGTYGAEFENWIYPKPKPVQEVGLGGWWEDRNNWRCWSCKEV
jgi:hypothetical protein